jgi:hypothetical protein
MHFRETNLFGDVKTYHVHLIACRLLKQELLGRTNRLLSLIRHGPHRNDAPNHFSIVACVFTAAVTFTETLRSNDTGIFTEPLRSNDKGIFT